MTVKVVLEFSTAAEAAEFLDGYAAGPEAGDAAAPAPKRGRPAKVKDAPAPAAVEPAAVAAAPAPVAAAAAPAAPAAPAATAVPFKDVADAITELAEKDRDKAVAILEQHGAKTASSLKPEQFASVVKACREALKPAASSLV
jgi:hypothetical protein